MKIKVHMLRKYIANWAAFINPFFAVALGFVIPISITLMDILFVAVPILTILSGHWREKIRVIVQCRVALCLLLLFFLLAIGLSYSTASFTESIQIFEKYDKLLWAIFFIPVFAEEKWRRYAVYAFLCAMVITLILSYGLKFGLVSTKFGWNSESIFKNYLEQNLLMAFTCYLLAWEMRNNKKYRWLFLVLLVLAIYNTLFMNAGRTGYIVFFALALLFLSQNFHWKGLFCGLICLMLLIGMAFTFSTVFKKRVDLISTNINQLQHGQPDTSVGLRIIFARESLKIVEKNPIFGTGTGSFRHEYSKLISNPAIQTANPHNEYLNITVQLGIIGFIVLILLFYFAWRDSYFLPYYWRFLSQALTLAMALGSFANSWLMDSMPGHFYVYFLALSFASLQQNLNRTKLSAMLHRTKI